MNTLPGGSYINDPVTGELTLVSCTEPEVAQAPDQAVDGDHPSSPPEEKP